MYHESDTERDTRMRELFENYAPQHVSINVEFASTTGQTDDEITDADIMQGTFTIDRTCLCGSTIEVGNASAAELDFTLNNSNGKFNSWNFEGATLTVYVCVTDPTDTASGVPYVHKVPMGVFVVDTQPRRRSTIDISALDCMRKFDQIINLDNFSGKGGKETVGQMALDCCAAVGVSVSSDTSVYDFPNSSFTVKGIYDGDDITYREILQKCCAIMGCNVYSDWEGKAHFQRWYNGNLSNHAGSETNYVTITKSNRYDGADIEESNIVVTGAEIEPADGDEDGPYKIGSDGYMIYISDNKLLDGSGTEYDEEGKVTKSNQYAVAIAALSTLPNITYRPFSCSVKPMPYLWPMDRVLYKTPEGETTETFATHVAFNLNGHTDVEAEGDSLVDNAYYVPNKTATQSKIATQVQNVLNEKIDANVEALIHMNEAMMSGMGLYTSVKQDDDGGKIYYFHDAEKLANSTLVFKFSTAGFMWTTDYKGDGDSDGDTVWQYGFTNDGTSNFQFMTLTTLNAKNVIVSDNLYSSEYSSSGTKNRLSVTSDENGGVILHDKGVETDLGQFFSNNAVKTGYSRTFQYYQSSSAPDSNTEWNTTTVYVTTIKLGGYYLHSARLTENILSDAWITYRNTGAGTTGTCVAAWWNGASPTTLSNYPVEWGAGAYIYNGTNYSSTTSNIGFPMWQADAGYFREGNRLYWIDQNQES